MLKVLIPSLQLILATNIVAIDNYFILKFTIVVGKKNPRKPWLLFQYLMAPGFLFAQLFFHVSMLALEPYSIMLFIKKTMKYLFH